MNSVYESIKNGKMYSVSETIENGKLCVSASPEIWIINGVLYWPPPDEQIDRSMLVAPGPSCKVLRENIGSKIKNTDLDDNINLKRPRYDNFLKSGSARPKGIYTEQAKRKCAVPTSTITKQDYDVELSDGKQRNTGDDDAIVTASASSQRSKTHCDNVSPVEDHSKKIFSFNATSCNTAVLTNNEKEDSYRSESEIGLQSDRIEINHRNKIDVLDNILIQQAPTTTRPQLAIEDIVKKHLDELSKAFEGRQLSFEARIEKKMDFFFNNQPRMHGSNRPMQNQTHQLQHQVRAGFNNQCGVERPSRLMQNQNNQWQHEEHPVDDVTPDFEDFEALDEHFPIEVFENVAELEYNTRKDLELKLLLKSRLNELTGNDPKKAIREKMKYLFTDPVLEKYTWRGTEKKQSFKSLKSINNLLYRSVRHQFKNYKQFQYKDYMVQWIKHAKSRQREVTYKHPDRNESSDFGESTDDDLDAD